MRPGDDHDLDFTTQRVPANRGSCDVTPGTGTIQSAETSPCAGTLHPCSSRTARTGDAVLGFSLPWQAGRRHLAGLSIPRGMEPIAPEAGCLVTGCADERCHHVGTPLSEAAAGQGLGGGQRNCPWRCVILSSLRPVTETPRQMVTHIHTGKARDETVCLTPGDGHAAELHFLPSELNVL